MGGALVVGGLKVIRAPGPKVEGIEKLAHAILVVLITNCKVGVLACAVEVATLCHFYTVIVLDLVGANLAIKSDRLLGLDESLPPFTLLLQDGIVVGDLNTRGNETAKVPVPVLWVKAASAAVRKVACHKVVLVAKYGKLDNV